MKFTSGTAEIIGSLAAPAAALAFGSLALELLAPGIVSRWVPLAPWFFSLLGLAFFTALTPPRQNS